MSDNSEMVMFDFNADASGMVPAHLQGLGIGVGQSLMAAIGESLNRIGLKGSRFRQVVGGQEIAVFDENYLDVIIVGVVPSVSRIYYQGTFSQKGENAPPTCYSVDNVAPPLELPTRQSDACATCQWNVKGSKVADDGTLTKACGYFRRMVIKFPWDETNTLYRIDVKAQGLFGDDNEKQHKYSMNGYAKLLHARGVDASVLVTRLSFDTNSSVPKLLFAPLRYVSATEIAQIQEIGKSKELKDYLDISFKTIDISKEAALPVEEEPDVPAAAAPAPQAQARPAATAPAQQAAPQRTTAQAAPAPSQKPVQAAPQPARQVPAATQAKPAATVQKPAVATQAKPAAVQQRPATVAVQSDIPYTEAATAAPVEVGTDDELASIIGDLGL